MLYIPAILKWGSIIIFLTIATVLLIPFWMMLMGFKVNADSGQIAILASEKRDITLCNRIINYGIFGPPSDESRAHCVFRYAKLTQDPTACELLLPSDYGWSCLGDLSGSIFEGKPCRYLTTRDELYCNKAFSEGEITIDNPQIDDCSLYQRNDLKEWCHFERTKSVNGVHECNRISHPIVHDYCEYNYAIKKRDPQFCSLIQDKQRKEFCKFRVDMILKYQ